MELGNEKSIDKQIIMFIEKKQRRASLSLGVRKEELFAISDNESISKSLDSLIEKGVISARMGYLGMIYHFSKTYKRKTRNEKRN